MKSRKKVLFKLLMMAGIACLSFSAFADEPNPPVVPGQHGAAGDVPVGAPIDSGVIALILFGAGYGALKLYKPRVTKKQSLESTSPPF
jgi:hypothetical protein